MTRRIGTVAILSLFATALAIGPALPQANTAARIKQCIADNKGEEQEAEVLQDYCNCMSKKMGPTVQISVQDWEKTHPKDEEVCADEAGWED